MDETNVMSRRITAVKKDSSLCILYNLTDYVILSLYKMLQIQQQVFNLSTQTNNL